MNCANHPEAPVAAYCQFCGKPLCAQCVHRINNLVGCAPCLEARVHAATASGYDGGVGPAAGYTGPIPPNGQLHPGGADPWIAFGLGFIPGVGAMYNGQFAKGIAHVIIFVLLVHLTHYNGLLGILVAAWIFYQVFDAYQTALARREGLSLPNPMGLNNVSQWFGPRSHWTHPTAGPAVANPVVPPVPPEATPAAEFVSGYTPPVPPIPPVPPNPYDTPDLYHHRGYGIPTGAVILIALGILFLLSNIGILNRDWLDHGWPVLLIVLGVWIVIRHTQNPPRGGTQ